MSRNTLRAAAVGAILVWIAANSISAFVATTRVSIADGRWHINGDVTNPGSPAEGLLMNVRLDCRQGSPYSAHAPYSLQFDVNTDGHIPEYPRDAFWKSGSGAQYNERDTGVPANPEALKRAESRLDWQPMLEEKDGQRPVLAKIIEAIAD